MKTWKSLGALLLFSFFLLGCTVGEDDYNPQEQLLEDVEAIRAFLEENNRQAEADPSGIFFNITLPSSGDTPSSGDIVTVDYTLYNFAGDILDTSIEDNAKAGGIFLEGRPYIPLEVTLGTGQVIVGFERAIFLLNQGARGTFYIPSALAYGNRSQGPIGPNENLIFDIELLTIE